MVLCEGLPDVLLAGDDIEFDIGASWSLSCDLPGGHVEYPIGGEPRNDVVVTGDGDESTGEILRPDRFGDGGGSDSSDVAIDNAGEFIEDDRFSTGIEQTASEIGAEHFTRGENVVGFEPTWGRAESDGRECMGDLFDGMIAETVDDGKVLGPGSVLDSGTGEEVSCDGGFAAGRGSDDESDFPVPVEVGRVKYDLASCLFPDRHIEHSGYLLDTEGVVDRAIQVECGHGRDQCRVSRFQ